jgi:predicted nucleic acid-binding protein
LIRPHPIDVQVLECARDIEARYQLNWGDCQIVATAQIEECAALLSEDMQDGARFGEVTVRSPFKLRVEEARALNPGKNSEIQGRMRKRCP